MSPRLPRCGDDTSMTTHAEWISKTLPRCGTVAWGHADPHIAIEDDLPVCSAGDVGHTPIIPPVGPETKVARYRGFRPERAVAAALDAGRPFGPGEFFKSLRAQWLLGRWRRGRRLPRWVVSPTRQPQSIHFEWTDLAICFEQTWVPCELQKCAGLRQGSVRCTTSSLYEPLTIRPSSCAMNT